MTKIEELLDMPEEEQYEKLAYYIQPKPWEHILTSEFHKDKTLVEHLCRKCNRRWPSKREQPYILNGSSNMAYLAEENEIHSVKDCPIPDGLDESLADLAFRLRDETKFDIDKGFKIIHKHLFPTLSAKIRNRSFHRWFLTFGKPKHFICAALKAKEMENKNDQKD